MLLVHLEICLSNCLCLFLPPSLPHPLVLSLHRSITNLAATHIHTYKDTYIHTYIHPHTYIHTCTYIHPSVPQQSLHKEKHIKINNYIRLTGKKYRKHDKTVPDHHQADTLYHIHQHGKVVQLAVVHMATVLSCVLYFLLVNLIYLFVFD